METVQPIRSLDDIARMKQALRGRDLLLFNLGINTGLRISDLLALKVGDVRNRTELRLREKKTGKSKVLRFNSAIVETLAQLDGEDDDYLFRSRECDSQGVAKPISRQQAYNVLRGAAERAGLNVDIGTHTLRKTFGYHAYKAGVDLATLQALFNHASQRVTLRYIGVGQDEINDVYEAVCL